MEANPRRKLMKHAWDIAMMSALMATSILFYYVFIPGQIKLRAVWGGSTNFSSRTFPNLLMGALFICAAIGLARALAGFFRERTRLRSVGAPPAARLTRRDVVVLLIPYVTYAIVLAYCILFREIGYVLATAIVPPALMFVLGCRNWVLYVCTYAFGAFLYVVFKILMNVPLP